MKIAFIGQKGMPAKYGGVERHVHELAARLVRLGLDVTVYSRDWYTNGKDGYLEGVFVKHIRSLHTKHFDTITYTFFSTIHAIKNRNDIIHYQGVGPSLLSFIPRIFSPNILVITTFHSMDRNQKKWGILAKFILKIGEWTATHFSHQTIVVSDEMTHYLNLKYNANFVCIPNGVPDFKKIKVFNHLQKWSLEPGKYILIVTRLIEGKRVEDLIEAYKMLKKKGNKQIQNKKLVIVGSDNEAKGYIKQLKKIKKGDKDIIFTGNQTGIKLAELFSGASLFVNPSENEGLPIAVLEAMSYSVPVAVSDISAHKQLIKDKDFVFSVKSVDSLVFVMEKVLDKNKKDLKSVTLKNKMTVLRNYNWDNIASETASLYKNELAELEKEAVYENI